MTDILSVFDVLADPKATNFWIAWQTVSQIFIALATGLFTILFTFFKWLDNSRIAKIERVLIFALVEDYENWVKVYSNSQRVDIDTLSEWLSKGKVALLGHDYSVFKNFMKRLQKNGREIAIPNEAWFLARSEEFKSSIKPERVDW